MLYEIRPSILVSTLVDSYFFYEEKSYNLIPYELECTPNGLPAFVFNYGDAYDIHQQQLDSVTAPAFLRGQITTSYKLTFKEKMAMAEINFKPAAISSIFGISMEKFTNRRVDLSFLLGGDGELILRKLAEAGNMQERFDVLEGFMLNLIRSYPVKTNYIDTATELVRKQKGKIGIEKLAHEMNVCRRHFQRSFLYKVGLNPKEYSILLRCIHICELLKHQRQVNWLDVVTDMGYYDQAHFIKDFIKLTGKNPSNYHKNSQVLH